MSRSLNKCLAWVVFRELVVNVREKIEEFKSKMPVIRTLGNPGFRDRHWESVSNIVGFPVKGGSNLFQILDMGLDEYVSKFEKISDAATKEFNLEKSMLQAIAMIKNVANRAFC